MSNRTYPPEARLLTEIGELASGGMDFDLGSLTLSGLDSVTPNILPMLPSAILIGDLPKIVPLFAVTRISLTESYFLPAVGSAAFRSAVG